MVNDENEEKFKYAKDPAPVNVHYEVKGVMVIFLVAFVLNIISDALKLFIPIDTGFKRKLVNALKGTHIFTILANCYGTYVSFSHSGEVCSCRHYKIGEAKGDNPAINLSSEEKELIRENACFGTYTNTYELLCQTLWVLLGLFIFASLIFFCTNACKRCKE